MAHPATTAGRNASAVKQAGDLVARMTLAQKIMELHGITDSEHQRYVPGIPSLGIPPLVITNGPAGPAPAMTRYSRGPPRCPRRSPWPPASTPLSPAPTAR